MRCFVFILLLLTACGKETVAPEGAKPTRTGPLAVVAVNYPLKYFAERIGGEHVRVTLTAPAGVDPADWRPAKGALRRFVEETRQAELILVNGANYAKWIGAGSWREAQLVHTAMDIRESLVKVAEEDVKSHPGSDGGMHSHGGWAYTIWLNPVLAVKQAEAIAKALQRVRPEQASGFTANLESLRADLEGLELPVVKGPLLASHPVYQYLEKRLDLDLKSVHWEPGVAPPAEEWAPLEKLLEGHRAKVMLWEGEPAADTAARLRALGVEPVVFAPLGNAPGGGEDYLSAMRANLARLKKAAGGE